MLTSQMTSISSQSSLQPLLIQATSSAMHTRPNLSGPTRVISNRQQTRSFRFGLWTRISNQPKDQRKQMKLKHLDAAVFSRNPGNYRHLMQDYLEWKSCNATGYGKRWVNVDALSGKHRPLKDGNNDKWEVVLDGSMGRTLWGTRCSSTVAGRNGDGLGSYPVKERGNSLPGQKSHDGEYEYDAISNRMVRKRLSNTSETTNEFSKQVPINTFKGYRSQFTDFKPPPLKPDENVIHLDGPPSKSELDSYKPFKYNEPNGRPTFSPTEPVIDPDLPPQREELDAYKPFQYNEPDGKSPEELATDNAPSKEELEEYKPFRYNEPDGHGPEAKDPVAEYLKSYDSKSLKWIKDLPVNDCETSFIGNVEHPNSEQLLQILERSRKHAEQRLQDLRGATSSLVQGVIDPTFPDDADKYRTPYKYNEPDGKKPEDAKSLVQASDFPQDAHKYGGPFKYNEPDGHAPEKVDSVAESLKEFDGKRQPRQELPVNDSETSYIGIPNDEFSAVDHEFLAQFRNSKSSKKWVGRSHWSSRESKSLDDFPSDAHKYKSAYRYNEPDGHAPENTDSVTSFLNRERRLLTSLERRAAIAIKQGKNSSEATSTLAQASTFIGPTSEELRSYNAYRFRELDGSASEPVDFVKREINRMPKEKNHLSGLPFPRKIKVPNKYSAKDSTRNSTEATWPKQPRFSPPKASEFELETPSDLHKCFDKVNLLETADRDKAEDLDLLRASDVRARSGIHKTIHKESDADKKSRRNALDDDFKKTTLPGIDMRKPAAKKLTNSEERKPMTGNYVRDFPEEFNTKWSASGSTLVPAESRVNESKIQQEENAFAAGIASQEEYIRSGSKGARIQSSLDRSRISAATKIGNANADELHKLRAELDPYSKEPQGLETSYAQEISKQGEGDLSLFVSSYGCNGKSDKEKDRELVNEVREIYEDAYGFITPSHRQKDASSSADASKDNVKSTISSESISPPTLYKILAFDPSSQSVKIAETTSIIPDNSGPSTPAEVLMRLSNPAKFFPHFEPLSEEGYEIVSGSGDVLIFRKVRDGPAKRSASATERDHRNVRNPVDGMTGMKPATGNFASPTGFVNHDLPQASNPTSAPSSSSSSSLDSSKAAFLDALSQLDKDIHRQGQGRFQSNIDVRREEPVFSGRRNWEQWEEYEKFDAAGKGGEAKKGKKGMGIGKRMVVGAGAVAGSAYAVGVVGEWLRTGGSDGVGMGGRF